MDGKILRVSVPSPLYRHFDYLAPQGFDATRLRPGIRLQVPFGRTRQVGILLELRDETSVAPASLRRVIRILDDEPILPPDLMALALWAQRYYHHPLGEVLATLLPVLLRQGQPARFEVEPSWRITPSGREALAAETPRRAPRQRALLALLAQSRQPVAGDALRRESGVTSKTLRTLRDKGWIEPLELSPPSIPSRRPPVLNGAQAEAVAALSTAMDRFNVFLLDGVTGSGKTEVYLRIVETVLARDRQALVMVPEIGLTPQLLMRFQARLSVPLAVLHSGLSDRERLNAWLMARSGRAGVVIGTRSAIFTPLPNLGVIIIDEEHDPSFKQQEGFRYHARDLAVVRAHQGNIPVVLGSATPSLESLHNVQRGRYYRLQLPERVGDAVAPAIQLLDVRRQPMEGGVSAPLLNHIKAHLDQQGQVLLFLNRRGYAPTLICHECGWLSQCRRCDARMTLHIRRGKLICHHCGAEQTVTAACPDCGSIDLRALGQGTERIEMVLQRAFPRVGIARIDRDNTRRKGHLQNLLEDVHSGKRRILIGTQMLAKGHHFPDVTLVGIVDADQGLFGVDYRAGERMAQLILQVAGRAGRESKPGVVIIQTHHPTHPLLLTLVSGGYSAFAATALHEREETELPPFACQALLRADATDAELPNDFLRSALELGHSLASGDGIMLLGPVPAPMERRAGRYRAQLLVQARRRRALHGFLKNWVERLHGLRLVRKVRWSLDVDPQDLL